MKKVKYFLAGIVVLIFMGCSSYYAKYDHSSVKQHDYNTYELKPKGKNAYGIYKKKTVCDNCKTGGPHNMVCGECTYCGAVTGVRAIKLCRDCSYKHSLCTRCLKPIK